MNRLFQFLCVAVMLLAGMAGTSWGGWGENLSQANKAALQIAALNLPPIAGTWYFADMKQGHEYADGRTIESAVCSLQSALNLCKSGRGDGVVLLADSTAYSFTVSRACTVNKTGVTIVGVSNGNPLFNRARVKTLGGTKANASGIHYVFVIQAENVQLINLFAANEDSGGYGCLKVIAARFYAKNCNFYGGTMADAGAGDSTISSSLEINGASEGRYDDCIFGTNSVDRNPTIYQGDIYLEGAQGQNVFNRCMTYAQSDDAQHGAVKLGAATTLNGWTTFNDCGFNVWIAGGKSATTASTVVGTAQNNTGLIFNNCYSGYAAWDAIDTDASFVVYNAGSSDSTGLIFPK